MGDKDDYLTCYRVFFENFAATVNPEDQLPVNIAGYTITEAELPGEVIYWTTQYLTEKQCPPTLMTPLRRIILDEVQKAAKKHPNEFGFHPDESAFIALRLMKAVMARANAVCLRYLDNARLDTLPPPALLQRDLRTVAAATKNLRRAMEDRHVVIGNLEALFGIEAVEPTSFYAVYDGHAGSAAATYCAAHLHQYLVESPYFKSDLQRAMRDAFLRTDEEFVRKSDQARACGGSTAVAVVVRGRRLLAAWAGDSLALLAKRMRLMQLVHPHKPDRQDERERIESSGGTILYYGTWRVNGQLAVSRAIGDAKYKPYVTARPEIALVELDGDEDFVVVACDGLWDFVTEDEVALSIYAQLAADPDDLKAVTKRLIAQAKREGSPDNITIIVVFLKDPRDIVADTGPPMDLGLQNASPYAGDSEGRKPEAVALSACHEAEAEADNGVSDSDSEDLGPETAVDADDVDAEARNADHGREPAAPTPPAHAVEAGHVDGILVDNVAESGEDSEDEWNYYKGEGEPERDEHIPSEEADEPPRSDTPCQDNSAWESSSVDMNSSPLNPDAPVFVPGGVAGSDVLLAESPRKPLPMDDIELPDIAQFETEAVIRPAELLDLDNSDQVNGHHNVSLDGAAEQLNGNGKCNMDSLGFGFKVNVESEKIKDTSLIQEFERIQKDTTDYCDIQVFQAHTETNPFDDRDDELFERLKNKERDPMSMSFYQEKDDDTCERFAKNDDHIDLNAVRPLPDSDDEEIQGNGACDDLIENDKENISPEQKTGDSEVEGVQEPNNDILKFDDRMENLVSNINNVDNIMDYNVNNTNNMQSYLNVEFECSNIPQEVLQTDTPESHKLLFEQIPEIPDGKSSELGFTNDDLQDQSEAEKDRVISPQDESSSNVLNPPGLLLDEDDSERDVDSRNDLPSEEIEFKMKEEVSSDIKHDSFEIQNTESLELNQTEVIMHEMPSDIKQSIEDEKEKEELPSMFNNEKENIGFQEDDIVVSNLTDNDNVKETPEIQFDTDFSPAEIQNNVVSNSASLPESPAASPLPAVSPLPGDNDIVSSSALETKSPIPSNEFLEDSRSPVALQSPIPLDHIQEQSPVPQEDITPPQPAEVPLPRESPVPSESPLPQETRDVEDFPIETSAPGSASPLPVETPIAETDSSLAEVEIQLAEADIPLVEVDTQLIRDSPIPSESPVPSDLLPSELSVKPPSSAASPLPTEEALLTESPLLIEQSDVKETLILEQNQSGSPLPADKTTEEFVNIEQLIPGQSFDDGERSQHIESPTDLSEHRDSPLLMEQPMPKSPLLLEQFSPRASPLPTDSVVSESTLPIDDAQTESPIPQETEHKSPIPEELSTPTETVEMKDNFEVEENKLALESVPEIETVPIIEPSGKSESPLPIHSSPVPDALPTESLISIEPSICTMLPETAAFPTQSTSPVPTVSPVPPAVNIEDLRHTADLVADVTCESRLTPEISQDADVEAVVESDVTAQLEEIVADATSGPTPDIVPDERIDLPQLRAELVTDIDIGIPESRAQEICVPVTSEIQQDDAVQASAATPPPTPAVEPSAAVPASLDIAPLSETPMAADTSASAAAAAVAAGAAVAVAAAATAAAKAKTPAKKSPTTPTAKTLKSATKPTTTPRTPASAAKKPASAAATPAARTPATPKPAAARTSLSAKSATPTTKATAKPNAPTAKAPAPAAKPAAKAPTAPAKEAPAVAKTASARAAAPRAIAPKTTAAKPAAAVAKASAAAKSTATSLAPRPAARPAPARPAAASASGASSAAAKAKEARPKPAAPKPLANGDVKPSAAKPSAPKAAPAARPAPRAAAPRPAPRPAAPPSAAAAPPAKVPVTRPAARAPLDKQSKDLANKRITAKAAPPRTATTKAPTGVKSVAAKVEPKKGEPIKKALANGDAPAKPPLSPPPADNATLPDVIA